MSFSHVDMMSPRSILRYPRWQPRWPPIALGAYISVNIEHREMILVSNSRFLGSRNPTKYIKITSGVSKWVNPKWRPRWPPKSINGYINVCSMLDSVMKVVTKYRFLSISYSLRHG